MGCRSLWQFLKKRHKAVPRPARQRIPQGRFRIDVQGSIYPSIRHAYSQNATPEAAHASVLRRIEQLGNPSDSVLYFDGGAAVEKQQTHQDRQKVRTKALAEASKHITIFSERQEKNLRIRKSHFTRIRKELAKAFVWDPEMRKGLVRYLREKGWTAIECDTEADLQIAKDFQQGDVAISGDSDLLAYASIAKIWRPMGRQFLEYDVNDVLESLMFTRNQLTLLGIVSRNDYHKNVFGLGCTTNYKIIRALPSEVVEIRSLLSAYLMCGAVVTKNKDSLDFSTSVRVFVDLQQTPASINDSHSPPLLAELQQQFQHLCERHERKKKESRARGKQDGTKTDVIRLRSSTTPNRYKTVESPAPNNMNGKEQDSSSQAGHPRHRPRYSFKSRKGTEQHPPPPMMTQYTLKPYREQACDNTIDNKVAPVPKVNPRPNSVSKTARNDRKVKITRSMAFHHPMVSLSIGTLSANVKRALPNQPTLQQAAIECTKEAASEAARVKREGQRLIGRYIECLDRVGLENLSLKDRDILDSLCPRIKTRTIISKSASKEGEGEMIEKTADMEVDGQDVKEENEQKKAVEEVEVDLGNEEEEMNDLDLGAANNGKKETEQTSFLSSLLGSLYSGNYPRVTEARKKVGAGEKVDSKKKVSIGQKVIDFISRLQELCLYIPPRDRGALDVRMPYTPSDLVRSAATQLAVELKKIYRNGTKELHIELKHRQVRGQLGSDVDILIREDVSAIENFMKLNKQSRNPRRIVPITTSGQPFIGFSERELAGFFFKRGGELKKRLVELASMEGTCTSIVDVTEWLSRKHPGYLLKHFIADIDPADLTIRQRGKVGHRGAIKLLSLDELNNHLGIVDNPEFKPEEYDRKGYVSTGSLRTDGFQVQLLCFKLKELQCVRFRRLPEDRLPPKITSTSGGVDYYMQEIRNVIKTGEDVTQLWPGFDPKDIKILALDAGQAYVVGAYAHLPQGRAGKAKGKAVVRGQPSATSTLATVNIDPTHLNLAVNQKAVLQPYFRYRRWLEGEKNATPEGQTRSVAEIESQLPPLRGSESSVSLYFEELDKAKDQLSEFYNGKKNRFKRHTFDMAKAKHAEYQTIANRLLGIVGGNIGKPRDDADPVLIAVGLGKFKSIIRMSSLDSSFLSYFIALARSLGYLVIGINEYYTSKKCPDCQGFVAQVTIRQLYCPQCMRYYHRDVMAAENMCNIARGYLTKRERPLYLQPVTDDGRYPWNTASVGKVISTASGSASTPNRIASSSTSSRPPRVAKRTTSAVGSERANKIAKL